MVDAIEGQLGQNFADESSNGVFLPLLLVVVLGLLRLQEEVVVVAEAYLVEEAEAAVVAYLVVVLQEEEVAVETMAEDSSFSTYNIYFDWIFCRRSTKSTSSDEPAIVDGK